MTKDEVVINAKKLLRRKDLTPYKTTLIIDIPDGIGVAEIIKLRYHKKLIATSYKRMR